MKRTRRIKQSDLERGFVLLGVILITAVLVAAVTLSLRGSTDGLQESSRLRSNELANAALNHGLTRALDALASSDPVTLTDPANDWDIFNRPATAVDFVPPDVYPPAGMPFAGELNVRVGLTPGQRTAAPIGEDVRNSYGWVVEVQVSAQTTGFGNQAEERVAVGVQIPHEFSHSK